MPELGSSGRIAADFGCRCVSFCGNKTEYYPLPLPLPPSCPVGGEEVVAGMVGVAESPPDVV
jgi:hypothetical protein